MKTRGVPGPLGLFCTALLVSALTLSVQSSKSYSQYDNTFRGVTSIIPIVTGEDQDSIPVRTPLPESRSVANIVPIVTPRPREVAPVRAALPIRTAAAIRAAAANRAAAEARAAETPSHLVVKVKKGDTLMDILTKSGVPSTDAEQAIASLKDVYNPRNLQTGQKVTLTFGPPPDPAAEADVAALESGDEDGNRFLSVSLRPAAGREIAARRDAAGDFAATAVQKELRAIRYRSAGVIHSSLSEAADRAGLPRKVLQEVIHAFSYDVDFQRDIQPGDSFEVLYERMADDEGNSLDTGTVDYAELTLSGHRLALYHYATKDGITDYFNAKGESVRKGLMRTPIDGARLSSRFGMRNHPILGYTRMHRGVDFAAPKGTPIYAAGNGVVLEAGREGGYGNYIEIRHNPDFSTGYGHMSRFAKGIHRGARVKQGEVIGYVGMTGLATGPHLHYEVIHDGKKVNPLSVKLPSGYKLHGRELTAFRSAKSKVDFMLAQLPNESKVASSQ